MYFKNMPFQFFHCKISHLIHCVTCHFFVFVCKTHLQFLSESDFYNSFFFSVNLIDWISILTVLFFKAVIKSLTCAGILLNREEEIISWKDTVFMYVYVCSLPCFGTAHCHIEAIWSFTFPLWEAENIWIELLKNVWYQIMTQGTHDYHVIKQSIIKYIKSITILLITNNKMTKCYIKLYSLGNVVTVSKVSSPPMLSIKLNTDT